MFHWQAQLVDMKSDVVNVQAAKAVVEKELHNVLLQLHAAQLQLQAQKGVDVDSESIKKKMVIILVWVLLTPKPTGFSIATFIY